MRRFYVRRNVDETGASGTGEVLEGVVFYDGTVAARWKTDNARSRHGRNSFAIFDSLDDLIFIHIDSHPEGFNELVFLD